MDLRGYDPLVVLGNDVEAFLQARYPDLSPPPPGKLTPMFVHTPGPLHTNPYTDDKYAPAQVDAALSLIADLVKDQGVSLDDIGIITMYKANVALIKSEIDKKFPSLAKVEAGIVEAYQGRDKPIIVVIMGTGPGLPVESGRLTCMMTRHRCAQVIVGNIYVGGPYDMKGGSVKKKGKGKKGEMLQGFHGLLIGEKRVAGLKTA